MVMTMFARLAAGRCRRGLRRRRYEHQTDEAKKRAANFTANRIPKFLGYFERILKQNAKGGDFVFGKKIAYVDLSLFQMIEGLRYAFSETMARLV